MKQNNSTERLGYSLNHIYSKNDPSDPLDPKSQFFPDFPRIFPATNEQKNKVTWQTHSSGNEIVGRRLGNCPSRIVKKLATLDLGMVGPLADYRSSIGKKLGDIL